MLEKDQRRYFLLHPQLIPHQEEHPIQLIGKDKCLRRNEETSGARPPEGQLPQRDGEDWASFQHLCSSVELQYVDHNIEASLVLQPEILLIKV